MIGDVRVRRKRRLRSILLGVFTGLVISLPLEIIGDRQQLPSKAEMWYTQPHMPLPAAILLLQFAARLRFCYVAGFGVLHPPLLPRVPVVLNKALTERFEFCRRYADVTSVRPPKAVATCPDSRRRYARWRPRAVPPWPVKAQRHGSLRLPELSYVSRGLLGKCRAAMSQVVGRIDG